MFPSEEVTIVPVPGTWIPLSAITPPEPATYANTRNFLNELKFSPLSDDDDRLCLTPVIPSTRCTLREHARSEVVQAPLKFRESIYTKNVAAIGFRSGRRSCIVRATANVKDGDWVIAYDHFLNIKYTPDSESGECYLRLKGCGMWIKGDDGKIAFPGFTLCEGMSVLVKDKAVVNIRGVGFPETCANELYISKKLMEAFGKVGMIMGNEPFGFWNYGRIRGDVAPLLQKSVSVFRTYGDYRLDHHLLYGLELFIYEHVSQKMAEEIILKLSEIYPNGNIPSDKNTTSQRLENLNFSGYHKFLQEHFNDYSNGIIEHLTDEDLESCGFVSPNKLYKAVEGIQLTSETSFVNLLKLFARIGWEAGKIISVIHRTGIIWGTFSDHVPSELHINSHGDNLYVLPKESNKSNKNYQILAPIDFDLAFEISSAINYFKVPPEPEKNIMTRTFEATMFLKFITNCFSKENNVCKTFLRPVIDLKKYVPEVVWMCKDILCFEYFHGLSAPLSNCNSDIDIDESYIIINEALEKVKYVSS